MTHYSAIMISELVNYVLLLSFVTDASYGILMRVRRKYTRNLIQDNAFMIEILTVINLTVNEEGFL
jgi:hypothetical protein